MGIKSLFPCPSLIGSRGRKLETVERDLSQIFDFATCATRAECETLKRIDPQCRCDWVSNGVDLDYFQPSSEAYDPDQICFVGRMDYFPNEQAVVHLVRDVFPLVRHSRPTAKITIVGSSPTPIVQGLAKTNGVTVTGAVPDVRPFLSNSALSVAPLKIARGTQNKILESMAMGVPVVASSLAARGVDAVPEEHIVSVDGTAETAEAILRILGNAAERQRIACAGRARVESHHSWPKVMEKLDDIVVKAAAKRSRSGTDQAAESILLSAKPT